MPELELLEISLKSDVLVPVVISDSDMSSFQCDQKSHMVQLSSVNASLTIGFDEGGALNSPEHAGSQYLRFQASR